MMIFLMEGDAPLATRFDVGFTDIETGLLTTDPSPSFTLTGIDPHRSQTYGQQNQPAVSVTPSNRPHVTVSPNGGETGRVA
jgi:hypothetical protein